MWQGQVQAALKQLQTVRPAADQEPIKAFEDLLTYLENQQEWLGNYEYWQQQGYPIGSGMVERESVNATRRLSHMLLRNHWQLL